MVSMMITKQLYQANLVEVSHVFFAEFHGLLVGQGGSKTQNGSLGVILKQRPSLRISKRRSKVQNFCPFDLSGLSGSTFQNIST